MLRSFLLVAALSPALARAQAVVLDRVVALVDGQPILRSQVKERMRPLAPLATNDEALQKLARASLDELVDEALVQHDADTLRLEVTGEDVDRALKEVASSNGLDAAQLEKEVLKQGYTMTGYRASLRQQLLSFRWLRAKLTEPQPTDREEANKWLDHERVRLIRQLRARAVIEVLP